MLSGDGMSWDESHGMQHVVGGTVERAEVGAVLIVAYPFPSVVAGKPDCHFGSCFCLRLLRFSPVFQCFLTDSRCCHFPPSTTPPCPSSPCPLRGAQHCASQGAVWRRVAQQQPGPGYSPTVVGGGQHQEATSRAVVVGEPLSCRGSRQQCPVWSWGDLEESCQHSSCASSSSVYEW